MLWEFSKYEFSIFMSNKCLTDNTAEIINDVKKIYKNVFVRTLPKKFWICAEFSDGSS